MNFMKSKVIAIVVAFTMTFSIIAMPIANAANDDSKTQKAANFLEEVGVLEGDNGNLMLDKELTRQDAVVLLSRLLGLESQAKVYSSEGLTFKDIEDDYYNPYIAWAQDNKLVQGYSKEKFGYGDKLTAWQTKALMVRALGHTDESDENIEFMAETLGITKDSQAKNDLAISRADMAVLAYNTMFAEHVDGYVPAVEYGYVDEEDAPVLSDIKASAESTAADTVTITGKVEPATAEVTVGETVAEVDEDGNFEVEVSLEEGENIFDVYAKNGYKTDAVEIEVKRVSEYEMDVEVSTEDSVKVTFNYPVNKTDDVIFNLKGTSSISVDIDWNEEKTVATLEAPTMLLDGAYTLTVDGLEFVDNENTATFVVVENGIAKIEILSGIVSLTEFSGESDGEGDLVLSYRLYDQYGVDITDEVSENELQIATSVELEGTEFELDIAEGKMTLDVDEDSEDLEEDDTVAITIIASETGVAVSETLKIADKSQVDKIEIKGIIYKDDDVQKILVNENEAAYINIEVFDQYEVEITDEDSLTDNEEVLYVVSDNDVKITPEEYTNDDDQTKLRLIVDTSDLEVSKNVMVTIVSKLSGKSASVTLEIKEGSRPDEVKIGSIEQMVAAGDQENSLILPISVYDQDGVKLTSDEIVNAYNDNKINVSGSGTLSDADLKIATSGNNKGKIVNSSDIDDEGTGIVTVTTDSDVDTYTLTVKEKAYAKSFEYDKEPATNLLDGAKTTYNYKFFDQYGREMENPDNDFKVTLESSDTDVLTVSPTTTNASEVSEENSVTVESAGKDGSASITAKLYRTEDSSPSWPDDYIVIDKIKTTISVTDGVPGSLIFDIESIPTLVALNNNDGDIDGDDPYSRPIIIKATDSNGKTYAIPDERIIRVTSSEATDNSSDSDDSKYIMISDDVVNGDIEAQKGYHVVAARELDDIDWNDDDTVTTLIRVMISTDEGVEEVTEKVTISKDQPEAEEVTFLYMPDGGEPVDVDNNPYKIDPEAEEIKEISGTVSEITSHKIYVYSKDQYGVYKKENPSSFLVINTDRFDDKTIEYKSDNTLEDFSKNDIIEDKEVHLMYEASNGVYGTFKIIASDGIDEDDANF